MIPRYEWVSGPTLISRYERTEFHAGKGVLQPKGRQMRLMVGQVRDTGMAKILNWTIEAHRNPANARITLREHADAHPRASDWAPRLRKADSGLPKGWTLPEPGAPFEQGLIA